MSITIKQNGLNPGFNQIAKQKFVNVVYTPDTTIRVKGAEHKVTRMDFVDKVGAVIASVNDYNDGASLANLILADEGGKTIGSFLKGRKADVEFPLKGTIYSEPRKDGNRGTWTAHDGYLVGVKWADFKVKFAGANSTDEDDD